MKDGESTLKVPPAASFRQFRNSNLFNPWGLSLELTERQFKAIAHIDKSLHKEKWYQGLSVFGSTMFGYSKPAHSEDGEDRDSDSDIDILPLADFSDEGFVYEKARAILRALEYEVFDTYHLHVNFQNLVNISLMHDDGSGGVIKAPNVNMSALEALSYWTTQNGSQSNPGRVRKWRARYRKLCSTLAPRAKETLKRNLIKRLMDREQGKEGKISDRIEGYNSSSDAEKDETRKARQLLWGRRVKEMFGL